MTPTPLANPLPKPRLILRLGGLGNRRFGSDSGLAENPAALETAARQACAEVFAQIELVLADIHREDQAKVFPKTAPGESRCPWWKSHALARVFFGKADRWERCGLAGKSAAVFSAEAPQVTVFTGAEPGGDTLIWQAARSSGDCGIAYEMLRITPENPLLVTYGLGIGTIPAKPDPAPVADPQGCLSRPDAQLLADIARRRAFGFRAQSEALRHHSDILLAVWDPDTEGKAGGTSESVAAALLERIPVIAVRLGAGAQASITVLQKVQDLSHAPDPDWKPLLAEILGGILKFPDRQEDPDAMQPDGCAKLRNPKHERRAGTFDPRAVFTVFLRGDPCRRIWPGNLWQGFDRFAKRLSAIDNAAAGRGPAECRGLNRCLRMLQDKGRLLAAILRLILDWCRMCRYLAYNPPPPAGGPVGGYAYHYGRVKDRVASNGMSGVYGDAHRGGIIAAYLLAAFAVLLALVGSALHAHHLWPWLVVAIAAVEIIVILAMLALAICAKVESWQEAYTDSRILAEALRAMEHLGPLGVHTPLPMLPYYLRGDAAIPPTESMWSVWYFRALVRMAPLRLGGGGIPNLRGHCQQLRGKWIQEQIRHHEANAAKQKSLHRGIDRASLILFVVVAVSVVGHLLELCLHGELLAGGALLGCAGVPALIAALHGFASQIEISRLRQRSASMVELLKERDAVIAALEQALTPPSPPAVPALDPASATAVWAVTTEALATAAMMMDEAADWSMLYKHSDIHF